jgi:hypothetical protein
MSRSFFIGSIAALAMLVSAGPALGRRSPTMSSRFCIGFVAVLAAFFSAGSALGANAAQPKTGTSRYEDTCGHDSHFSRDYLGVGIVAKGSGFSNGAGMTSRFTLSTIGCSSLRGMPKSCVESISTKYTMFLPARGLGSDGGGDTGTHEVWQSHQACVYMGRWAEL